MSDTSSITAEDLLLDLLDRLDVSESVDLEYKECRQKLPDSLWPTLSAFANTGGGVIVLGVAEQDGQLVITGVSNAMQVQQQFTDQLRNRQKISVDVCGADGVQRHRVAGVEIIVVQVDAVASRERPVYVGGSVYDGTYLRRNSGDYRATKSEIDRMMREASPVSADAPIVQGTGLHDLDRETLQRYRQRHQTAQPGAPRNGYDDLRFLTAIDGYRTDTATDRAGLTVAGLLMFGTDESIRQWRSRHLIDFRLEETDSTARWDDRVVWEGNLLSAFETIYPRLIKNLPLAFDLDGPYRIQEGRLQAALREALVNLLVHADYAERDASLIRRTPQDFLFRNPGASLVRRLDPDADDRSDPRNPTLVRMFRFIGLADEAGSGLPKIFRAWRESDLRPPRINLGRERYEFTLRLEYIDMLSQVDRAWLTTIGVSARDERLALIHARDEGMVDNPTLRTLTGLHATDATRTLTRLRDAGFLEMEGTRRGAWYRLGPKSLPRDVTSGRLAKDEAGLPNNDQGLHRNALNSSNNDQGLRHNVSSLRRYGLHDEQTGQATLPAAAAQLEAIAAPMHQQQRVGPEVASRVIVELCRITPMTVRDLARLLHRSDVRIRVLVRQLVANRSIVMANQMKPNDPEQRYMVESTPGETGPDHL